MRTAIDTLNHAASIARKPACHHAAPELVDELNDIAVLLMGIAEPLPGYDTYVEDFDHAEALGAIILRVRDVVSMGLPAPITGAELRRRQAVDRDRVNAGHQPLWSRPWALSRSIGEDQPQPQLSEGTLARIEKGRAHFGVESTPGVPAEMGPADSFASPPLVQGTEARIAGVLTWHLPAGAERPSDAEMARYDFVSIGDEVIKDREGGAEPDDAQRMNANFKAMLFQAEKLSPHSEALVRRTNGWRIMVTSEDGADLPEPDSWLVALWAGDGIEPHTSFASTSSTNTIELAVAECLAYARDNKPVLDLGGFEHPMAASRREAQGYRAKAREALPGCRVVLDDLQQRLRQAQTLEGAEVEVSAGFVLDALLDALHVMHAHQAALDAEFHTY